MTGDTEGAATHSHVSFCIYNACIHIKILRNKKKDYSVERLGESKVSVYGNSWSRSLLLPSLLNKLDGIEPDSLCFCFVSLLPLKCSLVSLFAQQELMLLKEGCLSLQFLHELLISLLNHRREMLLLRWIPLLVVIWALSQRKSALCLSRWV